ASVGSGSGLTVPSPGVVGAPCPSKDPGRSGRPPVPPGRPEGCPVRPGLVALAHPGNSSRCRTVRPPGSAEHLSQETIMPHPGLLTRNVDTVRGSELSFAPLVSSWKPTSNRSFSRCSSAVHDAKHYAAFTHQSDRKIT